MKKELLEAEIEKLKIACAIWARVNRQKYLECKARKEMLEKKLAEIKELDGELKKFKENINAERRGGTMKNEIKKLAEEIYRAGVALDGSDFAHKSDHFERLAGKLYKAGYRKQADVAREFAERVLKDISDAIDHNTRLAFGSISPETSKRALITNNACKGIYDTVVAIAKEYGVEE